MFSEQGLILFLDKIVSHLIMLLNIIRPKNEIPAFPAKAGKNLWLSSFSSQFPKRLIFQLFQRAEEHGIIDQ